MNPQQHHQMAYRASQLAHHMRRLSEAVTSQPVLNVNNYGFPPMSSTLPYPSSNSSSYYNSTGQGESFSTSPSSNGSGQSNNRLRTPPSPNLLATNPPTTTTVSSTYYPQSIANTVNPSTDALCANVMPYESPHEADLFSYGCYYPTAASYTGPTSYNHTSHNYQQSQGCLSAQAPMPSYHPFGYSAPFPHSFGCPVPSYQPETYPTYASKADTYPYGINPQALSLDTSLVSPGSQSCSLSPSHKTTSTWSTPADMPAPCPPRASSLSSHETKQPQPPKFRRHSDSYTSDQHSRPLAGPAKKGRKRKSGWSDDANVEWESVMDKKERRKMQNRLAQRAFRARMKANKT